MSVLGRPDDNEISLAFEFSYKGKCIILGGDGTISNWQTRRRFEEHRQKTLDGHAVNLPHHGSKYDCSPEVLAQLFSMDGERYGVTSANGISHPDVGVIEWLEKNSIKPYCTNLIPSCGANAQRLLILPNIEPQLARWIREVATTVEVQACQGDIKICIEALATLQLRPSTIIFAHIVVTIAGFLGCSHFSLAPPYCCQKRIPISAWTLIGFSAYRPPTMHAHGWTISKIVFSACSAPAAGIPANARSNAGGG